MRTISQMRKEFLRNPKAKKAYDDLELEFKLLDLLIQKRIKEKLTQTQLAKKLGVKQPVISQFERGEFNPTIKFLRKFTEALGAELVIKIK